MPLQPGHLLLQHVRFVPQHGGGGCVARNGIMYSPSFDLRPFYGSHFVDMVLYVVGAEDCGGLPKRCMKPFIGLVCGDKSPRPSFILAHTTFFPQDFFRGRVLTHEAPACGVTTGQMVSAPTSPGQRWPGHARKHGCRGLNFLHVIQSEDSPAIGLHFVRTL